MLENDQGGTSMKRTIMWLVAFVLILSFALPNVQVAKAVETTDVDLNAAQVLTDGQTLEQQFTEVGQSWFTYTPTAKDIKQHSHVKLTLKSDYILNITVYSSAEKAKDNKPFDQYIASSVDGKAIIQFPYAWEGPYYIKVEYDGLADTIAPPVDEEGNPVIAVNYSLTATPVTLAPSTELETSTYCPVEMSVQSNVGASKILKDIRAFRDGILSKTEEGRNLSTLYYKAAPFLAAKILTDSSLKKDVYKHLVTIQPLVADMNKNGASSTRVISKSEAEAITALYNITFDNVPAAIQQKLEKAATTIGLKDNLAGELVTEVVSKATGDVTKKGTKNQYIVKLKEGASLNAFKQAVNGHPTASTLSVSNQQILDDTYAVELDVQADSTAQLQKQSKKTMAQIEAMPIVDYIEPVTSYNAVATDAQYSYQWSLNNTGSDGMKNADIRNTQLQKLAKATKLSTTTIAVIDTGVDHTLQDLKNVVVTKKGRNYVDRQQDAMDDYGHGTHVAGIIAAQANNGYSMTGINQKTKILPVKVLDASGSGTNEGIALGIKYAVDQGAKIINLSLGGSYSRTLEAALKYAYDKNVAVIAASGNDGAQAISYPGSSRYVISVGATNALDVVSDYSNYGYKLDVVAPGSNIPSLLPNGNVTYLSGTSMAAPHVAAIVGLMKSANSSLKVEQIRNILHETTKNVAFTEKDKTDAASGDYMNLIGGLLGDEPTEEKGKLAPGKDLISGYGRVNGLNALSAAILKANVSKVTVKSTKVSGKALKGTKIVLKQGSKTLGKQTVPASGKFSIKIKKQKVGKKLTLTMTNTKTTAKATMNVFVVKK